MSKKVSIVIRAYNEERHIGRLLDGIEKQSTSSDLDVEVILVDSGSSDATVSIAAHMGAKIVHIAKEDFTFGRALNLGCAAAEGDILLMASAHVYPVYNSWISKMVEPFDDECVGLVYGRQVGNEITKFSEHQVFHKWFPPESNMDQKTPFCNNANCAIRRSLWEAQPYDEELTGLEDLDWAATMLKKGSKLVYESKAIIVHVHEETPAKVRTRYMREAIALKEIMPNVHFNLWDFFKILTFSIGSDLLRAARWKMFIPEALGILSFRFNQFYGTYLGHNRQGDVSRELKNRFYYPKGFRRPKYGYGAPEDEKGNQIQY